jgi:uncharacterized Zn ribbon protein
MPDLITVEISGRDSVYRKGDQISILHDLEVKGFESVVAYYNGSTTKVFSKIALLLLIVPWCARALENLKF